MSERQNTQELPEPSASLVLWRVSVECFLACSTRKQGRRFLRLMAEKLASEESLAEVFEIRPPPKRMVRDEARRAAVAFFRQMLPVFLARLPPE